MRFGNGGGGGVCEHHSNIHYFRHPNMCTLLGERGNVSNILGLRGNTVGTRRDSSSNTNYLVNFCQNGKEEQGLLYDSELSYNPSTGLLSTASFSGDGSSLTNLTVANLNGSVPNSKLENDSVTIGTTEIELGAASTSLTGLSSISAAEVTGTFQIADLGLQPNDDYNVLVAVPGASGFGMPSSRSGFHFNPQTDVLTCPNFSGDGSRLTNLAGAEISGSITVNNIVASTIDGLFQATSSGGYQAILFADTAASGGKQLLYNSSTFTYNPTLNSFRLLGSLHTGILTTSDITFSGVGNSNITGINQLTGSSKTIDFSNGSITGFTIRATGIDVANDTTSNTDFQVIFSTQAGSNLFLKNDTSPDGLTFNPAHATLTSGVLRAIGPTASNEPSLTLAYSTNIGQVEARGSDASTVSDMRFYVASEAFQVSHNPLNLKGSNGFVGVGRTDPVKELDVLFTTATTGTSQSTMSALFQTTSGGGKHGVGIGGDVITGNGFLQSTFNDTGSGFNLLLQPIAGNVGVGTTASPTSALQISQGANTRASIDGYNVYWNCDHTNSSTNGSLFFGCQYNGGFIGYISQATTGSVQYYTPSDYRVKENVIEMPGMLERVKQLRPIQFSYLEDTQDSLGFIAHEFKEVFPNNAIVRGEKDAMMNVCTKCSRDEECCKCEDSDCQCRPDLQAMDYGMLTPILVKAVQELASELAAVQAQYSALLERVIKLETV